MVMRNRGEMFNAIKAISPGLAYYPKITKSSITSAFTR
jgi:hypothetical protein